MAVIAKGTSYEFLKYWIAHLLHAESMPDVFAKHVKALHFAPPRNM